MKDNRQHEVFRLAAILYADNNYEVSPQTIHKKIIESALFEKGEASISDIILFIQDKYGILLCDSEVEKVLSSSIGASFDERAREGDKLYKLTKKRTINLESKVFNNIGDFIKEFERIFSIKAEDIINRYLYELFQIDISAFQQILKLKVVEGEGIKVDSSNFLDNEKDIINSFLNWDNPSKNKAIFDLSSLALEYCILTNKKNTLNFINLRNKQFYLDANVLYRALGINGDERRNLTQSFLSKFNQVGEKLLLTPATDTEFRDSIKFHIDNIRKHNNPKVNSQIYTEISINEGMYNYYHKWRASKVNANLDLFLAQILSDYQSLIDKFAITIDTDYPFDKNSEQTKDVITQLSSEIYRYKTESTGYNSAIIDAENIFWIEGKRGERKNNINEVTYFLISTDQQLRKWDYLRVNSIPIVMLPSQWLSILLRYVERSNDDYKSFVSFLNLRNNDIVIEGEQLQIVLEGISEITTNIETQRHIVKVLVDNKFKDVIDGVRNSEEIHERSKLFAKTETDKLLYRLESEKESLHVDKQNLEKEVHAKEVENETLSKANEHNFKNAQSLLKSVVEKYNKLKDIERGRYVTKKIRVWRAYTFIVLAISLLLILMIVFAVFAPQLPCNPIMFLFNTTDSLQSETTRNLCHVLYGASIVGIFGCTAKMCYSRFNNKKVKIYRDELERNYDGDEMKQS